MASPVTIKDVRTILTEPMGSRLIVVKIITSEPGLYGLGCATFTQRFRAVHTAIQEHLRPFLIGKDVDRIEDLWQTAMVNSYWRNGPVLNNAVSGMDMALWDIKGKRAGMPLYQLLGGKCREAAAVYTHAGGRDGQEAADDVLKFVDQGFSYVRVQIDGYGGGGQLLRSPDGAIEGSYFDQRAYVRSTVKGIGKVREIVGDRVELMHDIHERIRPIDAVGLAKQVEPFQLFFLEDPLAPEDIEWFRNIRQQCSTPIAMGEIFSHPREWVPLIENRLIDFIRMHISQMGGITPARNVAAFANIYGIRTAWHGPGDVSPIGHAANLHLDLCAPNFGIQEWVRFSDLVAEIFPGMPQMRNGYIYPNDEPGLGIDINEDLAAKYPCKDYVDQWTQARSPDGSPARP